MAEKNHPEKRSGPFAQDRSRTPPTKEQRENDYKPEKTDTGAAIKKQGNDDLGLPPMCPSAACRSFACTVHGSTTSRTIAETTRRNCTSSYWTSAPPASS
jgi:hypothetical protein